MDFEDYKTKIQKVSNILEHAKYPEDILNSKEIDFENDFQYICLNSTINSSVVNEVIVRLAQNGNKELVANNSKYISINVWNDIFDKNNAIKEIFIAGFKQVIENTGFVTYRDIESFIADKQTINVIYENIKTIIKKLCTYDRASLIDDIKVKENGVQIIKDNLEEFFKKGEYDISTTYSKILIELSSIKEISNVEILNACSQNLSEMLSRETAVDNETNVLLNWVYDAMEDKTIEGNKREELQKDIDRAIMDNFEGILDKTNYDKETIKILKLFSCTHGKFDNNKKMFIENSSKLIHMTKIYDLTYDKENKEQNEVQVEAQAEEITEEQPEKETIQEIKQDEQQDEIKDVITETEEKEQAAQEFIADVKDEIETIEQYNELIEKSNQNEDKTEDIINALIKSNLYETDQIIEKVVNKESALKNDETMQWQGIKETNNIQNDNMDDTKEFVKFDFGSVGKVEKAYTVEQPKEVVEQKAVGDETQNYHFSRSVKDEEALIVNNESATGFNRVLRVVKGFLKKVKCVIAKYKADRIGD